MQQFLLLQKCSCSHTMHGYQWQMPAPSMLQACVHMPAVLHRRGVLTSLCLCHLSGCSTVQLERHACTGAHVAGLAMAAALQHTTASKVACKEPLDGQ